VGSSNVLPPALTRALGGGDNWSSLRPESLKISPAGGTSLSGPVTGLRYLGAGTRVTIAAAGTEIGVFVPAGDTVPDPGQTVGLTFAPDALHVMGGE
jgi:putative spermidine/putrescine transport system ATP-binding protein